MKNLSLIFTPTVEIMPYDVAKQKAVETATATGTRQWLAKLRCDDNKYVVLPTPSDTNADPWKLGYSLERLVVPVLNNQHAVIIWRSPGSSGWAGGEIMAEGNKHMVCGTYRYDFDTYSGEDWTNDAPFDGNLFTEDGQNHQYPPPELAEAMFGVWNEFFAEPQEPEDPPEPDEPCIPDYPEYDGPECLEPA